MLGRAARIVAGMTGGGVLCGGGYVAYQCRNDEGTRRAVRVYSNFLPIVAHYRFVEAKHKVLAPIEQEAERVWRSLDEAYAASAVSVLGDLQGMYTKYGQTAAGFTNTLSDVWIQELRKLEDKVPPRPLEIVHQTILEETGKPWHETFESFDEEPLGSASIGQVHRATLKNGKEVAVKVQYPDSQHLFEEDMATIRSFLTNVAPEQLFTLSALEKQNGLEMDYNAEAKNLEVIGRNMRKHGFAPSEVVVPRPLSELCTRRMLVMDLLPGPKLVDGLRRYARTLAAREGKTLEQLEQEMRAKIEAGDTPSRYQGPSAGTIAVYLRCRRALDAVLNVGVGVYNVLVGWWAGRVAWVLTELPPNAPRVMDVLMRVHGTQLLVDGVFNADPHGGNFLMLPDDRIGLIDFGATKELTYRERLAVCLVFAALMRGDEQMMVDLSQVGGYKSKYGKKEVVMKLMQFGYDSWGREVTGGKNIVQFTDELKAQDPWHEVPDNFVMAQFLSIRLRALGLAMNHPVTCSDWWGPIALRVLAAEGLPYESWDRAQLERYRPELNMQVHRFG